MKLEGKTNEELVALKQSITDDPQNKAAAGSFFPYTDKARKKMDTIDRAIQENMRAAREASGRPVPCDGYSGRKQNKRR